MNNQELLLHEQTIGDNSPRTAGTEELGDRGQQMREEYQQILHGRAG